MVGEHLLEVERVSYAFGSAKDAPRAVDDVSFWVDEGETLGIVGESGSGKTTLGRCIVGLYRPTAGTIGYRGLTSSGWQGGRRDGEIQMIFQDPYASLDPRMKVREIVAEGLDIRRSVRSRRDRAAMVDEALHAVGLNPSHGDRYPHEFSGGQRQRVGIARALVVEPRLVVCDEPISALDVSIQAQIVNLLADLQRDRGLTYLFIAHDLAMVRHLSDRTAVMYNGRLVEIGPADAIWTEPLHPYTASLLSAVPLADPSAQRAKVRTGYRPDPKDRVPRSMREVAPGRFVLCSEAEAGAYAATTSTS